MMTNTLKCDMCGEGSLHLSRSKLKTLVDEHELEVAYQFHVCDYCGVEVGLREDLKLNAREVIRAKMEARRRVPGRVYKEVRKLLKLTQEKAGKIFGGGPVAFSKYENDDLEPSDAMDNLMWLVSRDPSLGVDLAARHGITIDSTVQIPNVMANTSKIDTAESNSIANSILATLHSHKSESKFAGAYSVFSFSAACANDVTISCEIEEQAA